MAFIEPNAVHCNPDVRNWSQLERNRSLQRRNSRVSTSSRTLVKHLNPVSISFSTVNQLPAGFGNMTKKAYKWLTGQASVGTSKKMNRWQGVEVKFSRIRQFSFFLSIYLLYYEGFI